jgi:phage terminase large subunit
MTRKLARTPVFQKLKAAYESGLYNVFVLEGGSRSSKTHSIIQFWIEWAYNNQGRNKRVIVSRLKATWLTGTLVKDFIDILRDYGLYDKKCHNKSIGAGVYTLFDTEFWFMGLDDEQRIHGMKSDAFWINEAVEASFDDYAQLMQRCNGFAILDYNPSAEEHWIYDKICKRPKTRYMHSTMLDNPLISQNAKDQILSYEPTDENYANGTADKRKWMIYGLGLRAALEGLIFEKDVHWDIVKEVPEWAKKTHRWGLDFGYTNDVTTISDAHWTGARKEVWIDELCYRTKMQNHHIEDILRENGLKGIKGYADSSDPKSIDEIYDMGYNVWPVKKPAGSVKLGIEIMKRYKIHITERSLNYIKEWKNYTYIQDKNGIYLNEPVDKDNHGIDATRYIFYSELDQRPEQRELSKEDLGFY